jgi:hypothetical protein
MTSFSDFVIFYLFFKIKPTLAPVLPTVSYISLFELKIESRRKNDIAPACNFPNPTSPSIPIALLMFSTPTQQWKKKILQP